MRLLATLTCCLLQAACQQGRQASAASGAATATAAIESVQVQTSAIATPAVLALQTAAEKAAAAITAEPSSPPESTASAVDPAAVALIVRWEITSQTHYTQRLRGVICPPGASGPTWGVGYDGGHQLPARILADWHIRDDAPRLAATSGQIGPERCRAARAQLTDVRVPYEQAYGVFAEAVLPAYSRATRRALPGVEQMDPRAAGALVSVGFNRGWSMLGQRNAEKRHIRDVCVPRGDAACTAAQIRAMKRLWPDTPGLRNRREAEARLAESGAQK